CRKLGGGVVGDVGEVAGWFGKAVEANSDWFSGRLRVRPGKTAVEHKTRVRVDLLAKLLLLPVDGTPGAILDHDKQVGTVRILGDEVDGARISNSGHSDQPCESAGGPGDTGGRLR